MKYPELLDPNASAIRDEVLDRMRRDDPIYWCEHEYIRAWLVTRYDDVFDLLKDDRLEFGSARAELQKQSRAEQEELSGLITIMDDLMSFMPRERHRIVQNLMLEFLSTRVIKSYQEIIEEIIEHLLEELAGEEDFDLVTKFANPIPARVVGTMVGLPAQDITQIVTWAEPLSALFWPYNYDNFKRADTNLRQFLDYLTDLMPRMKDVGRETLLGTFARAVERGEITQNEALINGIVTFFAGFETTKTVIASAIEELFMRPELLGRLKNQPELFSRAAGEILRYRPAVGWIRRTARTEFEYRGKTIKRGEVMYLGAYAANHDPAYFADPHHYDLNRESRHASLTFGVGNHYCLGAAAAKLEIELALSRLIKRFPELSIRPADISHSPTLMLMDAVTELPCALHTAARQDALLTD